MFGNHHIAVSGSEVFGGIIDIRNKDRLLSFLSGVNKDAKYLIYEYDVNGNPYHGGMPKKLTGSELSRISSWCQHVTHRYEIQNISGITLCSVSFTYGSHFSDTPERVARIIH